MTGFDTDAYCINTPAIDITPAGARVNVRRNDGAIDQVYGTYACEQLASLAQLAHERPDGPMSPPPASYGPDVIPDPVWRKNARLSFMEFQAMMGVYTYPEQWGDNGAAMAGAARLLPIIDKNSLLLASPEVPAETRDLWQEHWDHQRKLFTYYANLGYVPRDDEYSLEGPGVRMRMMAVNEALLLDIGLLNDVYTKEMPGVMSRIRSEGWDPCDTTPMNKC